jgi:hypothetical protein
MSRFALASFKNEAVIGYYQDEGSQLGQPALTPRPRSAFSHPGSFLQVRSGIPWPETSGLGAGDAPGRLTGGSINSVQTIPARKSAPALSGRHRRAPSSDASTDGNHDGVAANPVDDGHPVDH